MSYTVKNLKEVDDSAVEHGLSPALEARFAREPLDAEQLGLSYQRLAPEERTPFAHKHAQQEEIYVVVGGSGRARLDDEQVELRQWDALRISPDTVRAVEAGPDGIEFLALGAPMGGANDAELVS
jgi:mannose-6-phosphate isomerase-like protein (cupin superfamily)